MTAHLIFVIPVYILYSVFAVQLWQDIRHNDDSKSKRALHLVSAVFLVCGMCHVGSALGAPAVILDVGYVILTVAMFYICLTRQSMHFARTLDALDKDNA